jgi:DNA-binding transcriptional ArsR family regulator
MDEIEAIEAFSALAQPTRLGVFRQLAAAYPDDLPAGDIARRCDVPHNTMSSHLAILTRAGLTKAHRKGREIRYRANFDRLRELVAFLARDCCDRRPELCMPLAADLSDVLEKPRKEEESHGGATV